MEENLLTQWLERLGYTAEAQALHCVGDTVSAQHPYALEMQAMLRPEGAIRAEAVFDVEGVPTVVFVGTEDGRPLNRHALDALRQKLWNQNLVSVVIAIEGDRARAMPVRRLTKAEELLTLDEASPDGVFSAAEIRSSAISDRLPKWFSNKARVDHKLLENLSAAVGVLESAGLSLHLAQVLMGQILFVSYLEHREIVSDFYRGEHGVGSLHALVKGKDRAGVIQLIEQLRKDFNGDFLASDEDPAMDALTPWRELPEAGFDLLDKFLARVTLTTGQGSLWNYDFSVIPVELLSGLYESFLSSDKQAETGAYYTPRHLATFAIHQALLASPDPLNETIFDGACGSGILLTTAYRRLIALHEAKAGRQMGFAERRQILLGQIFGGDINRMACRVTSFSLYLSLMEGLHPADILVAQSRDGVKLPTLRGTNLCDGPSGDFFAEDHPFFGSKFSLIVSNPAWVEIKGPKTSADLWAEDAEVDVPLRQLAGFYSLRAVEFLAEHGSLCLILPIALLMGTGSDRFLRHLFRGIKPLRLFNFGDLQQLLFPTADDACHVFVGQRRARHEVGRIPLTESFDYCIPKAELSLRFGRLSITSADRHMLQTQTVRTSPDVLTTYMWGDAHDLALMTRLQACGTFKDFWGQGRKSRWINRKGIHFEDKNREAMSSEPLSSFSFVPLDALKRGLPVLHPEKLGKWPADRQTVVGLNDALMQVFDGPRILFPDGFSRDELNIRAVYFDQPASFNSSVGVIAGSESDAGLLRFAAAYLRSTLAKYFLMLTNTKMLTNRNGVHLTHIEPFPFFEPQHAPNPKTASSALKKIVTKLIALEKMPADDQQMAYADDFEQIDQWVCDYFDLSTTERTMVTEAVEVLLPSVRPRAYKSLYTLRQKPIGPEEITRYAHALGDALISWRDRMGGVGHFHVDVVVDTAGTAGGLGIVRVQYLPHAAQGEEVSTCIDDALVYQTLASLRREHLSEFMDAAGVAWLFNQRIWTPRGLYIARAMTRHGWLTRTALRDAEAIVRDVQQHAPAHHRIAA